MGIPGKNFNIDKTGILNKLKEKFATLDLSKLTSEQKASMITSNTALILKLSTKLLAIKKGGT